MAKPMTFSQLKSWLLNGMRMPHIYQPAMLRVLLERGGSADTEDIARALLSYDRSQIEYYGIRTRNMVGKVLAQNGIVEPIRKGRRIAGYRLLTDDLEDEQVEDLKRICDDRLAAYMEQRGADIWGHRTIADGRIPGSVRYEVLKRARYRCELCGAHEEQAALHIDHIIPRARGGSDDISNFQALCITCNTNKRDRDDTDFRGVHASYDDRMAGCIFCGFGADRVLAENELCFAVRDAFPVTPMQTLVIPKRHVADYFDLHQPELNAIHAMQNQVRANILQKDASVTGFNVGVNAGADAGQTVFHVHVHLIPRRHGDVTDPRGGVRGVIPDRQNY